jgi:aminoglycoside phosphotransferase (APT) family kinase protein
VSIGTRRATGTLTVSAAPLQLAGGARLGTATVSWDCRGTDAVEVRLNSPDGALFCRGGSRGAETTGAWVHDGMVFVLRDVSGGAPAGTIATVAARLDCRYGDLSLHDALSVIVGQRLGDVVAGVRLVPTHQDSLVCEILCRTRSIFFKGFLSERGETAALEGWAYDRLRLLGVPAPAVLLVDTGGARLPIGFLLMTKVEGSPLAELGAASNDAGRTLLRQAGAFLRQIHGVDGPARSAPSTWADMVHSKCDESLRRVEAMQALDAETLDSVRAAFERRHDVVQQAGRANALLHGDFDTSQVFADLASARLVGILDFDDVTAGDPAWDLATLAHRDGDEVLRVFLEGYEPDAALTPRLPAACSLYSLIHDLVDVRVSRARGWLDRAERATARLRERVQGSRWP